ncbi:MAG: glucoamylase family protein [Phycisphaerae bacterium]
MLMRVRSIGRFATALLAMGTTIAHAKPFVRVAGFEAPLATAIQLYPGSFDPSLTLDVLRGGTDGAPFATDGERLVRLSFTNEPDRKIEFGFHIIEENQHYDLSRFDALLLDVFVETPTALPGLVGVYSGNWDPPSAWQPAVAPPTQVAQWQTIRFPLNDRSQRDLSFLGAIVFENMAGTSGTMYVDHLRLEYSEPTPIPSGVATLGLLDRNEITWDAVHDDELLGYHVYASDDASGPFEQLTTTPIADRHFVDVGPFAKTRYYALSAVTLVGETARSVPAPAQYNGLTDEELLDQLQNATFNYFWHGGHPVSGMIPEPWDANKVAVGGSGMGLMAIVVGTERGWTTRAESAIRIYQMLTFLEDVADRFHGAWPHVVDGTTGASHVFGKFDDGADLVETAFVAQGLLTVRQYFNGDAPIEIAIRDRATRMWEAIEWDWFRRDPDSLTLWWHWSPNHGWAVDLPIRGYHEAMIVYLLAIASPTHPMPPESYYEGWASRPAYANGDSYYGIVQDVSEPLGGPLFFTHYSALGFDPRFKRDAFTNYFVTGRAMSRIHRAYSIDNPRRFVGYHRWLWGLTASMGPHQYLPHAPTLDNGTIAPTAALSAMPYTPTESLQTLRYLYDTYGAQLNSPFGFYDALNPTEDWVADDFISIDQAPIVVMIENFRSGLCWRLFMQNPEIRPMLAAIGFTYEPDLNHDGTIDADDAILAIAVLNGPDQSPHGDTEMGIACDRDEDGDVDIRDLAQLQRSERI